MNNTEEKTLMDNIKELYPQINKKVDLFEAVADVFGLKNSTVKINWFHGMSIPDSYQARVVEIMQNIISNQKKTA